MRWPWSKKRRAKLSYDAAAGGRRTDGWITSGTDANAEIGGSIASIRNRSRDLARNNPHAIKALNQLVNDIIGPVGIVPRFAGLDADVARMRDAWREFSRHCDPAVGLGINGICSLSVRTWLESGSALLWRRWRRTEDGLSVPLQLQLLEPDHLDSSKDQSYSLGARVVQGIEFDPDGRRSHYHILPYHPGDSGTSSLGYADTQRVPASEIAHLFRPLRPGQVQGVPALAGVARALRDIDDVADAERMRRKLESCIMAFVSGGDPDQTDDGNDGLGLGAYDSFGRMIETIEPGLIAHVAPGKDIKLSAPASVQGAVEWIRDENRRVASGAGVTYEALTGDLSNVNFTSYRAGQLGYRTNIRVLQTQIVIPLLMERIYSWFSDAVRVAGLGNPDRVSVSWVLPPFEEVDREKEAKADAAELRNGFADMYEICAKRGHDAEEVARNQARFLALLDELGLVLDSDPRKTSGSGQANQFGGGNGDQDTPETE